MNTSEICKEFWPSFYPWYSAMMQARMNDSSESIVTANEEIWLAMEEVINEQYVSWPRGTILGVNITLQPDIFTRC